MLIFYAILLSGDVSSTNSSIHTDIGERISLI